MVKGQKKLKLGRKASHKRALVINLIRSLFTNGYLTTTSIKAKALREQALKLGNDYKVDKSLSTQKRISQILGSRDLLNKLEEYLSSNELKIKLSKIGYRDGDKSETSRVSLVGFNVKKEVKKDEKKEEKKKDESKKEAKINKIEKKVNIGKVQGSVKQNTERSRTRSGL